MSNSLKSYVEKFLLNPAASFNVDEEGNQDGAAEVVDALQEGERAEATHHHQPVTKLRARSAAALHQQAADPRYRGKKVTRKDLNKDADVEFDPELSKYFLVEDEEEGGDDDGDDDDEGENVDAVEGSDEESGKESLEEDEDVEEDGSEGEDITQELGSNRSKADSGGVTFDDDGDFSKFADDDYDDGDDGDDDDDDDDDDDESEEDNDMITSDHEGTGEGSLKKFLSQDQSEEVEKGQAVKNQLAIYDSLFEGRISLQKVLTGSNQLPQHKTFQLFLKQRDPHYNKNLLAAKSAARHLLSTLVTLQELLLKQNPETNHIITGKKPKFDSTGSDEEITSSEDDDEEETVKSSGGGMKRKLSLEDSESVLSKRHAAMLPFRDHTINKWYEKTKLLSSHHSSHKFGAFEVSALQQLHNILGDKQQLIRRTQLSGTTRGATYQVLGKQAASLEQQAESEEHDPEIFDDTDFYTRSLEEVLKSKVALSDNMNDVSRKWIEIQNLRRKAKKKVDKKASKGRKVRYEVMSKLQQYLAPCLPPHMDDAAINTLFSSLFGRSAPQQKSAQLAK